MIAFTYDQLKEATQDFPNTGFFYPDEKSQVLYYEFICDNTFSIKEDYYEIIDVRIEDCWNPLYEIASIEKINDKIANGSISHFRCIAVIVED